MDRSKGFLWVLLILALLLGAIWQFYPIPSAQGRLNKLPLNGPGFTGKDVTLSPEEEKFFANVNLIKRLYKIDNDYFFVTVLDGSHNRHVVHDPYYCFRGAGWSIDGEQTFPMPAGDAKLIEISKGKEKRQALYWFSDGKSVYTSPMRYWWQSTLRRVTLGSSGPEPILIIIQPLHDKPVDWKNVVNVLHPLFKI